MRGYVYSPEGELDQAHDQEHSGLPSWESLVVNTVGTVIEFWGFKRNQGKVWALLYLRDVPMDAAALRDALDLSKGAVSMIVRELESWGVVRRVRLGQSASWHFVAQVDLLRMIGQVFQQREVLLVRRVKEDLAHAERLARLQGDVPAPVLERIARMRKLAGLVDHALGVFLRTAKLDLQTTRDILTEEPDALAQDEDEDEDPR